MTSRDEIMQAICEEMHVTDWEMAQEIWGRMSMKDLQAEMKAAYPGEPARAADMARVIYNEMRR